MYDYLIVGAGFSGAVIAERLATLYNKKILVIEKRNHIAGNAYDEYMLGILANKYGPHIFHTNRREIFKYLSNFTKWRFYEHKVLAHVNGMNLPFPINRITLNLLYNLNLKSNSDTFNYYNICRENRIPIRNSEDIIVSRLGRDLYEKFFRNYSIKQWGLEPKELSRTVCSRIPFRTNTDCRYFTDKYQYMPEKGYTSMFHKMLSHKNIEVVLNLDYKKIANDIKFKKLIFTGAIDSFFDYEFGRLNYRSSKIEYYNFEKEHYQQCAQINYMDGYPYTRIVEYKYISGQTSPNTIISKEYPGDSGEEFYPVLNIDNKKLYSLYKNRANSIKNVTFCGRLAQYKYLNMDQTVANAFSTIKKINLR